jgi:hypothetical protein
VVSTFAEALNALLDAYERIAEQLPMIAQLQSLFGGDANMQLALAPMYQDIFMFHKRALIYFKRSGMLQCARPECHSKLTLSSLEACLPCYLERF